jgi:cytochrome P450
MLQHNVYDVVGNSCSSCVQVLERVRAEQAAVVAKHGQALTSTALRDMRYTSAVLSEGLRVRSPVGGERDL